MQRSSRRVLPGVEGLEATELLIVAAGRQWRVWHSVWPACLGPMSLARVLIICI